ncbi:MAG: 3D domain-containing protein [Gaiellaceae bacterium]
MTLRAVWIALCTAALAATVLPATGAGSPPGAGDLQARESALSKSARAALLDLYSLDTRLAQERAHTASLDRELTAVRDQRLLVQRQLRVASDSLEAVRLELGRTVRHIYESGPGPDPIAILLGASSFDEAISQLENLRQVTLHQRAIVRQVGARAGELRRLSAGLESRSEALALVARQAHAAADELARARDSRAAYVRRLRQQQSLTHRQLARVEAASARATARSQALAEAAAHASATSQPAGATATTTSSTAAVSTGSAPDQPASGPPRKGTTMVVVATAYDLPGTTAAGLPVGIGIVATDPTVIPLGTRFYVPGYGPAVAADTGSAVKGARIDVWLPPSRIGSWATHTLTITFL